MKVAILNDISRDHLRARLGNFNAVSMNEDPDLVVVRSADMTTMKLPDSLIAIGRAGSGVNNIPMDMCSQKGIAVFNARGANANAVKELVLGALMIASRNIVSASDCLRRALATGKHVDVEAMKKAYKGVELRGKQILVIGLGAIGGAVACMCKNLDMIVTGYDPYMAPEKLVGLEIARNHDELRKASSTADYLTLHCGVTEETKGMIDLDFLHYTKPGLRIVNFDRAELINVDALYRTLGSGRVAYYVSDFPTRELCSLAPDRVFFLPHLGASTAEAESGAADMVAERLADFWTTGTVLRSLNFPDCALAPVESDTPAHPRSRLLVSNLNTSGVIAKVTKVLSAEGFNIAQCINVSRGDLGYNIFDLESVGRNGLPIVPLIKVVSGVKNVRLITKTRD